jgi:UDP-2-acetamido-3-amino-2,3-dideoxy-glucuronate N-acetyltransferase
MSPSEYDDVFVHESAYVDEPCQIGGGTKIWHFSHVSRGVQIGSNCTFGQNAYVGEEVQIGANVKVQNNVSIYTGCKIEDDVFLGPSCVLTNVSNPRSQVNRQDLYEETLFRQGATVGANATIVCGSTLGRYCFIGAGAVITGDVSDYALMLGNPGRQKGWMSRHGHVLRDPDDDNIMVCPESGFRYQLRDDGDTLRCLDLDEDKPLPDDLKEGTHSYDTFRS